MTLLDRAEATRERLDEPEHDPAELEAGLDDVAAVNRWLGGRSALLEHLPDLLPPDRPARILDVGTGSADLPRAIADWARHEGREVRIVATDVHPQMLEIARRRSAAYPEITAIERADALELPYADAGFDVALLSLTLHHFDGRPQARVLGELARVAGRGVLVGELERSVPNYVGAKLLSWTLWRGNRLTRHDGPLSVRRAFTPDELEALARRAGLSLPRVHRHFFHRLVLEARSDPAA